MKALLLEIATASATEEETVGVLLWLIMFLSGVCRLLSGLAAPEGLKKLTSLNLLSKSFLCLVLRKRDVSVGGSVLFLPPGSSKEILCDLNPAPSRSL